MTIRCQGLFPPHPLCKGKALGTRLLKGFDSWVVGCYSTRFAAMLQNKFYVFFYRFTVPLNRTGMTKSSLCGGVCTQARPEVNMHKRNHEKDSGNSIMKIWPWGRGEGGVGAMNPVAQASAHQRCGANHQDRRPMLFRFLVIFTHRLAQLFSLNAQHVEKVYRRPFKQMSWPNKEDLVLF